MAVKQAVSYTLGNIYLFGRAPLIIQFSSFPVIIVPSEYIFDIKLFDSPSFSNEIFR